MSLLPNRLKESSYHRTVWCATLENGVDPEKLVEPSYWAHCANFLKPYDRIEAMPESGEWFAELMVVEVGKLYARVTPMRLVHLVASSKQDAKTDSDPDFSVEWKGPTAKWCVIRKHDAAILYRELPSKPAALARLAEHTQPKAA